MDVTELATNTTALTTMVTSVATALFTIFPVNLMITGGLAKMSLGILRKGKKVAIR